MAKGPKVQYDESGSGSDSEEEELLELLQEAQDFMNKKREEFKEWHKRHRALEQSFEDNLATHEALLDFNEKLKDAHSFLHAQRDEPIAKDNIGVTCDLIVENICAPIVVATNLSCSTSKATPLSDPPLIHLSLWKMRPSRRRRMSSPMH
jgi:hypothetical protein